jgi:hypothetical protein
MANEMMAGSDKAIVPDRDIKPALDNLEGMLAAVAGAGEGMAMEGAEGAAEMVGEEMAEDAMDAAASEDVQMLADALGVDAMQAQALMDAAQQMEKTRGKSAKELADMLASDFGLRMQLEKLAGGAADQMAMEETEVMETETPE